MARTGNKSPETSPEILGKVAEYYSGKVGEFGATSKGVDWNSTDSQITRFTQLARVFGDASMFSVNDIGCGYGALLDFLVGSGRKIDYRGFDVSPSMLEHAIRLHPDVPPARFSLGANPAEPADYSVASGIFNVKLDIDERDWLAYVDHTIERMNSVSRLGFAFNCLTAYSDRDHRRPDLFYADPCHFFDLCMRKYSRSVSLLHDYGLFEFTVIVRKQT